MATSQHHRFIGSEQDKCSYCGSLAALFGRTTSSFVLDGADRLGSIATGGDPEASPAMSAIVPKAEEIQSISSSAVGRRGLMVIPE
jgi:hypothetical protein